MRGLTSMLVPLALVLVGTACRRAAEPGRPVAAVTTGARAGADAAPPPRGTFLALLYSSNVRGEYEPCG